MACEKMTGTVFNLFPNRGFGFIRGENHISYFMHARESFEDSREFDHLANGDRVLFTPSLRDKGEFAIDVERL